MIHKYSKSQAQLEQVLLSQSKQDMNLTHDWSNLTSLIADGSQMFYASIYLFFVVVVQYLYLYLVFCMLQTPVLQSRECLATCNIVNQWVTQLVSRHTST